MSEHSWVSAHLFYHGSLDLLVTQLVGPLTAELAQDRLADRFFFLRHWDGGPHLRLRVSPLPGCDPAVRSRIGAHAAAFFSRNPSADRAQQQRYAKEAPIRAAGEGLSDFLRELRPNNSLAYIDYRREHRHYGYGTSMPAVEDHFVESSQIALQLVRTGGPARLRTTAALSMMVAAWYCSGYDPAPILARAPATADDASYARQRTFLRRRAHSTHQLVTRGFGVGDDGALAAWVGSVVRLRDALDTSAPAVIDRCAHLACNRLGLSPPEELHVRYLAARTMVELATGPGGHCRARRGAGAAARVTTP